MSTILGLGKRLPKETTASRYARALGASTTGKAARGVTAAGAAAAQHFMQAQAEEAAAKRGFADAAAKGEEAIGQLKTQIEEDFKRLGASRGKADAQAQAKSIRTQQYEGRSENMRGRIRASNAPVLKRTSESKRSGLVYYKRPRHVRPSIFAGE